MKNKKNKQGKYAIVITNDNDIFDAVKAWPRGRKATITLKHIQGIDSVNLDDESITDIGFKLHAFEAKLIGVWESIPPGYFGTDAARFNAR